MIVFPLMTYWSDLIVWTGKVMTVWIANNTCHYFPHHLSLFPTHLCCLWSLTIWDEWHIFSINIIIIDFSSHWQILRFWGPLAHLVYLSYLYWWANVVCGSVCLSDENLPLIELFHNFMHCFWKDFWSIWLVWSIWLLYWMGYLFLMVLVCQCHCLSFHVSIQSNCLNVSIWSV